MNSGQKVGKLKGIVLKIIAKNYDNLLEAPTETKEICLERNRILLGKCKTDSVPETNAALPRSGFVYRTRTVWAMVAQTPLLTASMCFSSKSENRLGIQ